MIDTGFPTFMGLPHRPLDRLDGAPVVVLGASEAAPYDPATASHSAGAPGSIRAASQGFKGQLRQHDFDLGWTPLPFPPDRGDGGWIGADAGDVPTKPGDAAGNRRRIESAVRAVLDAGARPLVLGGDDSVPIPVVAAFDRDGPLTVVQVDAHVDWGDAIRGEGQGYGSPMRRVAEMPWVAGMLQVGIRGLGSGAGWQHGDARAWGSRIVTSREWHGRGADAVLDMLPRGGRFLVSIDCDGIDPAVFPAVAMPTPGGLTYEDMLDLMHGLAVRGTIAGLVLAEYVPDADDARRSSALVAARIAAVAASLMRGR
jgi:agmatinase